MRGGRVLRDAQNVYQAGFDVPAADAEGAAPGDAAAQQQQKAEQRVRRANEQTEQAIRLLVFIADSGERISTSGTQTCATKAGASAAQVSRTRDSYAGISREYAPESSSRLTAPLRGMQERPKSGNAISTASTAG